MGNKTRSLDKVRTNQVVVSRRTRYGIKCIREMTGTEEQFSNFNIFIRF
ncbi:MAG TPA: hypothetical protein VIY98_08595 [Nitrososphaeraceae archaeon]